MSNKVTGEISTQLDFLKQEWVLNKFSMMHFTELKNIKMSG